jgi:ankyrin repeat protein
MDSKGRTALDFACKSARNLEDDTATPLRPVTRHHDYIRRSSNSDIQGKNLRKLAQAGELAKLRRLLDGELARSSAGKAVDQFAIDCAQLPLALRQDRYGTTALMVAANGHAECVELLLERGADGLARDHQGKSSLMFAVARGHLACARCLIPHSHVDAKSNYGETSLQVAHRNQNKEMLDALRKVARLDRLNLNN